MKINKLAPLAIPLLFSACNHTAFAGGCLHEAPREASIAVDDATKIRVVAGAGSLDIVGKSGMTSVEARGTACAEKESQLDGIRLIAERRGDTLWIESVFEDSLTNRGSRGLSFTVELPDSLALDVKDGSGSVTVHTVHGPVDIEDGSGGLEIDDIHGDLTVRDGSGGVSIRHVVGAVRVRDGSGGIVVDDVEGDLTISEAGSGGVNAHNISGRVDIPKKR